MKANEEVLLKFLQKANHFIVPIYQRTYSWTEKQCEQLWKDIIRAGQNQEKGLHFVGSVVYIQDGIAGVMNSSWQIIDGQQRLTTVSLLLEALSQKIGDDEPVDGFTKIKIRNRYLLNPEETGDRHYKLSLTDTDDSTLRAIVSQLNKLSWPTNHSLRISANYDYFLRKLETADVEIVCRGLSKLAIVDVSLERGTDNPQLIFESMNSTGKELSQADLIRNFILMDLNPGLQEELYKEHWRPMEVSFGQAAYADDFDNFMRYYLTVRTGFAPKKDDVYEAFKSFTRSNYPHEEDVRELVKDIHLYADYFCRISYDKESHPKLKMAFNDLIGDLGYSVTLPTLLKLFKFFDEGALSDVEFIAATRLIESYVFRRAIVGIPTSSMNKTFAALPKDIDPDAVLDSLKARLHHLQTYRRFPSDEEFARAIMDRDMYNMASRSYWLRRLENLGREKELVNVEEYSIEHILPQNPNLSTEWVSELGENWKEIQQKYLHMIGNLTLTGYNPEYSDLPFKKKRDMEEKGLRFSPLNLNQGFGEIETWNSEAIEARAKKLSLKAVKAWPSLEVSGLVLSKYQPKNLEKVTEHTLDDHEYLHNEDMRALFEQLNEEILALDPNVSSEVLKLYIAYRLETNFVDIVPQKSRLRLSLNMKFHDLDDPLGLCKDVTNIGRWGNGDVEIGVKSQDDIPYVMGLIRQSLERQLN